MRLSYVTGGLGILWLVTATPQQILTVFVRNALGASPTQLGLLVGVINLMAVLHLASIWFYRRLRGRKKPFFMASTILQRCMAFVMAWAAFQVAAGGSRQTGLLLVLAAAIVGAVAGNISGSGWWAWIADLVPGDKRAAFFGRRSAISQVVNVAFFFCATLVLDLYVQQVFVVYGVLFLIGGIGGVLDILLHGWIPEPDLQRTAGGPVESSVPGGAGVPVGVDVPAEPGGSVESSGPVEAGVPAEPMPPAEPGRDRMEPGEFLRPLRDPHFRRFCLLLGLYLFSLNLAAPFLAPFTTDPAGGGAPNVWLGISFVISQSAWVIMAPFWGMLMDRMGKKPVVVIGGLFVLSWLGYLVLSPENYMVALPAIAVTGGLLAPAFWEGISQFMLDLSPDRYRTAYSAWYWTAFGLSGAVSPLLGGLLYDFLLQHPVDIAGLQPSPFQLVVVVSVVLVLFSLTHLGQIPSPRDRSVRAVVSTILNPGVFRAVSNIAILSRPTRADVVERTLHSTRGGALGLSFAEICIRLDDPDVQVREAAARALARLGSSEALEQIIQRLQQPDSLSRPMLARALGQFAGLPEAQLGRVVQVLAEVLADPSEEVQVEAASALGRLAWQGAARPLLESLRDSSSLRVRISSAEAAARLGAEEAGLEIFALMHQTDNWVLRRQLAIALGDLFGHPGEIYYYMTGESARNIQAVHRLAELAERRLARLLRSQRVSPAVPDAAVAAMQTAIRTAAARYDRADYAGAHGQLLQVWEQLPPGIRSGSPRVVQVYWQALDDLRQAAGKPAAQDIVLQMYSLYRLGAG